MTNKNRISGFIVYLPHKGNNGQTEFAQVERRIGGLGYALVRREPYLLAVSGLAADTTGAELLLDVFPGTAASPRLANARVDSAATIAQLHERLEHSAQCYNILRADTASFAMESDALGLKPAHIAETAGGYLLGSRITDLLRIFPALAAPPDTVALYELMIFRSPLAERTLHRRIRRTLPGGRYAWTPDRGLIAKRLGGLRPAPVDPLILMDRAIEAVRTTAAEALQNKTAGIAQPIQISLSGGFDSRFIAALCREQHIEIHALSYGRRQTEEWHSARAVAQALDLELEMLHYRSDNTLRQLDRHLQTIEGTADPATSQILNLLQASLAFGSPILHGYCGDPLAGSLLSHHTASEYSSHEALADGILRFNRVPTRPELADLFEPAVDLDEVHQDVLAGLRRDCPPHQACLCWDLENRQRRYVGSTISMLGERLDPVMPFYDRRLFDLWTSMPPIALVNRTVFRHMLAHYYPALARIPHPEQPAPITPNLDWQIRRLRRSLPKRVLANIVGEQRSKNILLRLFRHDYIWNLGNLAAPQQRAYMLSRIEQLRPALEQSLGITLSERYQHVLSDELQALRNLFLAAEYAHYQARRISHEAIAGAPPECGFTQGAST